MLRSLLAGTIISASVFVANAQAEQQQQMTQEQMQQQMQQQQQQQQDVDISDKKVNQFVSALIEVDQIRKDMQQQLSKEAGENEQPSQEQMQKANEDFQKDATKAIEGEGLSMEDYMEMTQLMRQNQQFQQQVQETAADMQSQ